MKELKIEDQLCEFIRAFCDDLSSLELLLYFSRHPNTRFNRSALLKAGTAKRFDIDLALEKLIDRKVVVASSENNISLFTLTGEEPLHSLACRMPAIDQSQWQIILLQILDAQDI